VIPVLALPDPGRLIDVGSGNGSPGLVLALLRDDLEAILLEPRARRWAFLREATRAAGRGDVEVLRRRHDQYEGPPAPGWSSRAGACWCSADGRSKRRRSGGRRARTTRGTCMSSGAKREVAG
jgi:hypothetical protein